MVWLDRGFALKNGTKFRNQSVTVTIQVPVGKKIVITRSVNRSLNSFHFNSGRSEWNFDDEDWNNHYENWSSDVEYIMTPGGLERINKKDSNDENSDDEGTIENYKKSKEDLQREYDKKQKEAEELKKELNKPIDSIKYQYKKSVSYLLLPNKINETISTNATDGPSVSIDASRMVFMQMLL